MKKKHIIIFSLIFAFSSILYSQNVQEYFLKELYDHKKEFLVKVMGIGESNILSYKTFKNIMIPYLQRAKKELPLFNYCFNAGVASCADLCEQYRQALIMYSDYLFPEYILGFGIAYYVGRQNMIPAIAKVKKSLPEFKDMDIEEEWKKTTILLLQASDVYYKSLSIRARWRLFFKRLGIG